MSLSPVRRKNPVLLPGSFLHVSFTTHTEHFTSSHQIHGGLPPPRTATPPEHPTVQHHSVPRDSIRFHGLRAQIPQHCLSLPSSDPTTGRGSSDYPRLLLSLVTDWRIPGPSPQAQLICWSSSRNSGKHLLRVTSFLNGMVKDTDEQPDAEIHRARSGRVSSITAFVPTELGASPAWCECVHPSGSSLNPILLGFYGSLLT